VDTEAAGSNAPAPADADANKKRKRGAGSQLLRLENKASLSARSSKSC
jgi:hypothetical protein